MQKDQLFARYLEGNWHEFSQLLEQMITLRVEEGDHVQLSRLFSYYGIVNLYLGNQHIVSTVYHQISGEYRRGLADVRITAAYTRLLAIYYAFAGDQEQAALMYRESLSGFREADWYEDEAAALLEAIYWCYLPQNHRADFYHAMERLKVLNVKMEGKLSFELQLLDGCALLLKYGNEELFKGLELLKGTLLSREMQFTYPQLMYMAFNTLMVLTAVVKQNRQLSGVERNNVKVWNAWVSKNIKCPLGEIVSGLMAVLGQSESRHKNKNINELVERLMAKTKILGNTWYQSKIQDLYNDLTGNPRTLSTPVGSGSQRCTFTLFQAFTLKIGDRHLPLDDLVTRQEKELLLFLLLSSQGKAHKEVLAEVFFAAGNLKQMSNRLYVAVHRINRSLQEVLGVLQDKALLHFNNGVLLLNQNLVEEIDVHTYRKLLSVANQLWSNDREAAVELLEKAIKMYSLELVPEMMYLDWLDLYREELKNLQGKGLSRLAAYYREAGKASACDETYVELLHLYPENEDHYEKYIRYLLDGERASEAKHWYCKLERALQRELGVPPSPKIKKMLINLGVNI